MNPVLCNLAPPLKPAGLAGEAKSSSSTPGGELFRSALAHQQAPVLPPVKPVVPTAPQSAAATRRALETKLATLMQAGATQAEIVDALAAQLAGAVSEKLAGAGAGDHPLLKSVFAAALAPPGDPSATGSAAERARALAKRFMQLQSLATSITGTSIGQQTRFAGHILDAQRAKDTPALAATGSVIAGSGVLSHGSQTASGNAVLLGPSAAQWGVGPSPSAEQGAAPAPSAVLSAPVAPLAGGTGPTPAGGATPAGDGRTVNLQMLPAIATGGDSTLGRVLARAAVAADARQTASPVAANAAPTADVAVTEPGTTVAAFVKSFEAAVAELTPQAQAGHQSAQEPRESTQSDRATTTDANPVAAYAPTVAPFKIDRTDGVSDAAPAPPAPAIDHSAIADQVLRGAFLRNTGQSSEMRLSLVPESLGDVTVKLVINSGSVTAHVLAQTPEVRDALVAAQPQLAKSLADAGLKLSGFTVDLSGSGFAGFAQQQQDRPQGRGRRAVSSDDPSDDGLLDAIPSFGPSIAAPIDRGDYNYLA